MFVLSQAAEAESALLLGFFYTFFLLILGTSPGSRSTETISRRTWNKSVFICFCMSVNAIYQSIKGGNIEYKESFGEGGHFPLALA